MENFCNYGVSIVAKMTQIYVETEINASKSVCFDVARNIDFYKEALIKTQEIPVSGKTTCLLELGGWVTWGG